MNDLSANTSRRRSFFFLCLCVAISLGSCADDEGSLRDPEPSQGSTSSPTPSSGTSETSTATSTGTAGTSTTTTTTTTTDTTQTSIQPLGDCEICSNDSECGSEEDRCIQLPNELDMTCASQCEEDLDCPETFTCTQIQDVPPVRLCIPPNFICRDRCIDVECGENEVCDPRSGECREPLGLCDLGCLTIEEGAEDLCGGPDDVCLYFEETDERFCALDCLEDPTVCPTGYFCAGVGDDRAQCVPDVLTCVDRCSNTSCPSDEVCEPRSGECVPRLGLCDTECDNNALCGDGPEDICLAVGGEANDESFCSLGCEDARDCPLNYFCAALDNRELGVCVPLDLTCIDRCSDADCAPNENCDPLSGECVVSELTLCQDCSGSSSVLCGGQEDICLNLGESSGTVCTQDCSETDTCPQGYTCRILTNTTQRACIPEVGDCLRCAGVTCQPGETCDPGTGDCIAPQRSCLDVPCDAGEICNPDTEECEIIGERCTFETRLQDCFGPVRKCTATRSNTEGVCALICQNDGDCSPEAPRCKDLYRVGPLCVPDSLGAPNTCGITALDDSPIGRPCGLGVVAECPPEANVCIQEIEPDIAGFCSTPCSQDADCGASNTCQDVRGQDQRFCLPTNCLCLAGQRPPDNSTDLLTQVLALHDLSRCSFALNSIDRAVIAPTLPNAALQTASVSNTTTQPLSALSTASNLSSALLSSLTSNSPTQHAFITATAQLGISIHPEPPSYVVPDDIAPLLAGLRRFIEASGGTWDPNTVEGELNNVPADAQEALAQLFFAMAEVVEARADSFSGLTPEDIARIHQHAPYLTLRPPTDIAPVDSSELLALLQRINLSPLLQATSNLLATLEHLPLTETLAAQDIHVRVPTPSGWVIFSGLSDDTFDAAQDPTLAEPIALLVDTGGDDTYTIPLASTLQPTQPISIALDLDGDDLYNYTQENDPRDQDSWLPSDADGRFDPPESVQRMDGPVSLSDTGRQASGRAGVAILMDFGTGNDTYSSLRMSQGSAVVGAGILVDAGGADSYEAEAHAQGAGLLGVGLLIDQASPEARDTWRVWHTGQGFGGGLGAGFLLDEMGPSNYIAVPATGPDDVLYFALPDRSLSNANYAQGAGAGRASSQGSIALGGGVGALFDAGGDDLYQAAIYAQGSGRHLGAGFLLDRDGNDTYEARHGSQGSGTLVGSGVLLDHLGEDRYNLDNGRLISALVGHGGDLGVGVCVDKTGDDQYRFANSSAGAGLLNGAGLFFDLAGTDLYTTNALATLGAANAGLSPNNTDDPRASLPTFGIFIDAGPEEDTYDRVDLEGTPEDIIGNQRSWVQPSTPSSSGAPELGAGVDGDGATGYE